MSDGAARGGVVVETDRGLAFVPAELARRIASIAGVAPVPGVVAPTLGIAVSEGQVLTVLSIGGPDVGRGRQTIVICDLAGEQVGLAGGRLVATGVFEADGDGVRHDGRQVPAIDVRALYAHAEAAVWAARAERRERVRAAEDERVTA
jgi:hypothetical protein